MPVPSYPSAEEARREEGFIHAKDRTRLYWQRYTPPSPRGTVAVAPGGGDHSGRYPAVTAALVRAGFQVALVDFRGHGQSDGRRWHCDAFADYVDDLDVFLSHVREGAGGAPLFVLGHSMGALIAATWGFAPGRGVAGFVLSSPYFRLKLEPPRLKVAAAQLVGRVLPWVPIATNLRLSDLTSDEEMQRWTDADPLYGRATTPRWFNEAARAQEEALRSAHTFAYPLLVLVGGDDPIADPEAARTFLERAASADKELRRYEGFRHELFNERERDRPIADAVAWVGVRAGVPRPVGR